MIDLPFIPQDDWRLRAECGKPDLAALQLWDDRLDDFDAEREREKDRRARHEEAKDICRHRCPVRQECSDGVNWRFDEGIRGGHKIPSLDRHRTAEDNIVLRRLRKGWSLDRAASGRAPSYEEEITA